MIDATFWVAISFFLFLVLLFYLKVPQKIDRSLNESIKGIKSEIEHAEKLKDEAKNILSNYDSKIGKSKIEIKKIEWELKHNQEKLGAYIYKCNKSDGAFDFSNDIYFNDLIDKIKENKNFIDQKNKN